MNITNIINNFIYPTFICYIRGSVNYQIHASEIDMLALYLIKLQDTDM